MDRFTPPLFTSKGVNYVTVYPRPTASQRHAAAALSLRDVRPRGRWTNKPGGGYVSASFHGTVLPLREKRARLTDRMTSSRLIIAPSRRGALRRSPRATHYTFRPSPGRLGCDRVRSDTKFFNSGKACVYAPLARPSSQMTQAAQLYAFEGEMEFQSDLPKRSVARRSGRNGPNPEVF